MYFVAHLIGPVIYSVFFDLMSEPLDGVLDAVLTNALLFSLPYWLWCWICVLIWDMNTKNIPGKVAGKNLSLAAHAGFVGLHALWFWTYFLIWRADVPESGNGWMLYLFGSPIAMGFGGFIGYLVNRVMYLPRR